jgi:hypothetical protein
MVPVTGPPLVDVVVVSRVSSWSVVRLVAEAASDVCVPYAVTVTVTAVELLPASFASPPYVAVMVCCPTASEDVLYVATPLPFTASDASVFVPSKNVTLPVGTPPLPATVAVSVTELVTTTDALLAVSFTLVVAWITVSASPAEVLAVSFASPWYPAVIVYAPTASVDVDRVATPEAFSAPAPSSVLPL